MSSSGSGGGASSGGASSTSGSSSSIPPGKFDGGAGDPIDYDISDTGTTSTNANRLRRDLAGRGDIVVPPGSAAHHIVESTSPDKWAVQSRAILKKFDIPINHNMNGVSLTTNVKGAQHGRMHNGAGNKHVYDRLSKCTTRDEVLAGLNDLAVEIEEKVVKNNGKWP
jgi:hypothetical protein